MSEFNEEMSGVGEEVLEVTEVSADAAPEEKKEKPELHWYVVHTYSGYENKVKVDIEKTIENRRLQDQIFEVLVPIQDAVEPRERVVKEEIDGEMVKHKKMVNVEVQRKLFPGYVFIRMYMNEDTWFVVRNTRGVTGFVGPDSKPVPLSRAEMENLGIREILEAEFEIGDLVEVITGAYKGKQSTIKSVNAKKRTITITLEMLGRETSVEMDFLDVKKL